MKDKRRKDIGYSGEIASAKLYRNKGPHPALRIVIPKAVIPKAVTRNRIKRIFREGFRCANGRIESMIIHPKKRAERSKMQEAREFIEKASGFFLEKAR